MLPFIAVGAAALVGYIATRPGEFTITRTQRIKATPDRIFPHINDFHKWEAWSPWEKLDPNLKRTYSGSPAGPGAVYEWSSSDNKVGQGRMEITSAIEPTNVGIRLDFIRPWKATNDIQFSLVPEGTDSVVTWSMKGNRNFVMKAMGMVMDMDKLVGADFEKGLDALKAVAEA